MAITVKLYSFKKRDNSTKRPSTEGLSYNCELKAPCGIVHPTIVFSTISDPHTYNYAYIPKFERYYYIVEWTYGNGVWIADLSCDVLATYRTEIGNSPQYVMRSSHSYNGQIIDSIYPTIALSTSSVTPIETGFEGSLDEGVYRIGVVNGVGGNGAVQYFMLSANQFHNVCRVMFSSDADYLDLDNITAYLTEDVNTVALPVEIMKSMVNPAQYITSCMWFPPGLSFPKKAESEHIKFGWWDSGVSGRQLSGNGTASHNITFTLSEHTQAGDRGSYLNMEPYTRTVLDCSVFGYFPLDMSHFTEFHSGTFQVRVDAISGEGILMIRNHSGHLVGLRKAQFGVNIELASITRDYLGAAVSAVNTAADVATAGLSTAQHLVNPLEQITFQAGAEAAKSAIGGIASGVSGVVSTIKAAQPVLSLAGSEGSAAEHQRHWNITQQFYLLAPEDNANRGRPLCQVKYPKDIPGFIMCADADISTAGIGSETALCEAYMNGGFFYE